ncbi:MAG: Crp/Fnr family transcriptional regulator [Nitrospirae bacterium]|nr:Crp/Fnr family transcriptional regulator [Nitrospirota bacterium]
MTNMLEQAGHKNLEVLEEVPLFAHVDRKKLALIASSITKKKFKKGETIIQTTAEPGCLYVICSGIVKLVDITEDGHEQILDIRKKGDLLGEASIFDGESAHLVIALTPCEISRVPKANFEAFILEDIQALRQLTLALCSKLREAWSQLQMIQLSDAEQKIRAALNLIASQYGEKTSSGIWITIRLTQSDIAAYTGLTQETVSKAINKLTNKGEIRRNNKKQILLKPGFFHKKDRSFCKKPWQPPEN